jgi:hypothetical protein
MTGNGGLATGNGMTVGDRAGKDDGVVTGKEAVEAGKGTPTGKEAARSGSGAV